jgi:hypothetical protein
LKFYGRLGDHKAYETLYNRLVTDKRYSDILDWTTFSIVMDLYYQSSRHDSIDRCVQVLDDLKNFASISLSSTGVKNHRILNLCFNSVISKLCKTKNPIHINKAYDLLIDRETYSLDLDPVDIIHYNMVLFSLLQDGILDPCTKALNLLQTMRQSRESGRSGADVITYTQILQILLKYRKGNYQDVVMDIFEEMCNIEGFQFDRMIFELLLNWLPTGNVNNLSLNAKKIFGRMRELNQQDKVSLTSASCNIFLKALSSSADDCHDTLLEMIKDFKNGALSVLPDRVGFNTVIQALSSVHNTESLKKAEKLLTLMIALNEEDPKRKLGPDTFTASALLSVIVSANRSDAGSTADDLMARLNIMPDDYVYNRHLSAWAKCSSKQKLERVLDILHDCVLVDKASIVSYNTALNAFAHCSCCLSVDKREQNEKEEIYRKALRLYNELCSKYDPDDVTFTTMIRVITLLCENVSWRHEEMMKLFNDYCRMGLVTFQVLDTLKSAVPSKEDRKMIFNHPLEGPFDVRWSRKVRKPKKKMRQNDTQ